MDREQMRNMRWLYDDEASYQKAMRRIHLEQLKEQRDKEALRKARKEQLEHFKLSIGPLAVLVRARLVQLRKLLSRLWVGSTKVQKAAVILVLVVLVIVPSAFKLAAVTFQKSPAQKAATDTATSGAASASPTFDPALSPAKTDSTEAPKYDSSKKVLAFPDKIKNTRVVVSQQPLPEAFKKDVTKYDAFLNTIPNRQAVFLDGGTGYMAVTDDGQVQYSVLMTTQVLAFIKADTAIPKQDWQNYLKDLKLQ